MRRGTSSQRERANAGGRRGREGLKQEGRDGGGRVRGRKEEGQSRTWRDASLHVHVHWYRYLCPPVNHVKVVWFVVGFYGGELKRSFRHRHSPTVTVLAGAATGAYELFCRQAFRPRRAGDELFVKLACLVYAGEFAFLTRQRQAGRPFFLPVPAKSSNRTCAVDGRDIWIAKSVFPRGFNWPCDSGRPLFTRNTFRKPKP